MAGGNGFLKLQSGERGTIAAISGFQSGSKRLADLGFVRGAQVTMVRQGNPCIVRIDGRCVGLGAGYQESIELMSA